MYDDKLKERIDKSIKDFENYYDVDTESVKDYFDDGEYLSKKVRVKEYMSKNLDVVNLKFYCIFKINKNDKDDIFCKMILNINDEDISDIRGEYIEDRWIGLDWSDEL